MKILAERMRKVRKGKNLRQIDVAKTLGVGWTTYQRYESDEREPMAPFIADFARYFNVSTDYLLGLSDTP